jgi:hypothetical protein
MRVAVLAIATAIVATPHPPPADAQFDYQLGGDYEPPAGVTVVSRDWFAGEPLGRAGSYSICYVNAYQTQPDEPVVARPDARSQWPPELVLADLGDDPHWAGEYLVDLSSARSRAAAAEHVAPMIDTCAAKGFQAVELDNLDSWTRLDVPFGQAEAVAYAELLADHAHAAGLAVGQKNAPELAAEISRDVIGFDFVVAEECGVYDECAAYTDVFGSAVIDVEYTAEGFAAACDAVGDRISVVLRDVAVSTPEEVSYVYDSC